MTQHTEGYRYCSDDLVCCGSIVFNILVVMVVYIIDLRWGSTGRLPLVKVFHIRGFPESLPARILAPLSIQVTGTNTPFDNFTSNE